MKSILTMFLLWVVCCLAGLIAAVWMLGCVLTGSSRGFKIALGFDQLANTVVAGHEDETISSRCWRCRDQPKYAKWVKLIDWLFNDRFHCKSSFEYERRSTKIWPQQSVTNDLLDENRK